MASKGQKFNKYLPGLKEIILKSILSKELILIRLAKNMMFHIKL